MNLRNHAESFAKTYVKRWQGLGVISVIFFLVSGTIFSFYYQSLPVLELGATRNNLARYLKVKYDFTIKPENIIVSGGTPQEFSLIPANRTVYFLGTKGKEKNNDIYALHTYLSNQGIPLGTIHLQNLSQTPHFNETKMAVWENRLAFISRKQLTKNNKTTAISIFIFNRENSGTIFKNLGKINEYKNKIFTGTSFIWPVSYKLLLESAQNPVFLNWKQGKLYFFEIDPNKKIKKYLFDPENGYLTTKHPVFLRK